MNNYGSWPSPSHFMGMFFGLLLHNSLFIITASFIISKIRKSLRGRI